MLRLSPFKSLFDCVRHAIYHGVELFLGQARMDWDVEQPTESPLGHRAQSWFIATFPVQGEQVHGQIVQNRLHSLLPIENP